MWIFLYLWHSFRHRVADIYFQKRLLGDTQATTPGRHKQWRTFTAAYKSNVYADWTAVSRFPVFTEFSLNVLTGYIPYTSPHTKLFGEKSWSGCWDLPPPPRMYRLPFVNIRTSLHNIITPSKCQHISTGRRQIGGGDKPQHGGYQARHLFTWKLPRHLKG